MSTILKELEKTLPKDSEISDMKFEASELVLYTKSKEFFRNGEPVIKAMVDNKKWGDPHNYDITITRTGEGFDTEYTVMPNPHSVVDSAILEKYEEKSINLGALYENKNPFE